MEKARKTLYEAPQLEAIRTNSNYILCQSNPGGGTDPLNPGGEADDLLELINFINKGSLM